MSTEDVFSTTRLANLYGTIARGEVYFSFFRVRVEELTVMIWVKLRPVSVPRSAPPPVIEAMRKEATKTDIQVGMVKGRILGESVYIPCRSVSYDERRLPIEIGEIEKFVKAVYFHTNDFSKFPR